MICLLKEARYAIFDEVLPAKTLRAIWEFIKETEFSYIQSRKWTKVHRLLDGNPLQGPLRFARDGKAALSERRFTRLASPIRSTARKSARP